MKCLTEAHTAGLGQRGVAPRSWPPTQCSFHPYSCCLFLVVIMRVLGYWPSGWSPYSYGNSRTQSLGAGGTSAASWLDWSSLSLVSYCDMKPAPDMCLALLSGQGQTTHPHACLWRGCLHCEPKTSFAEFTVEAGSEIPFWRVFLVLPESQNVVMRPLALRLSKESPKWPLSSSGSWRLVQWAGAFDSAVTPAVPGMMGQAQLELSPSIRKRERCSPLCASCSPVEGRSRMAPSLSSFQPQRF